MVVGGGTFALLQMQMLLLMLMLTFLILSVCVCKANSKIWNYSTHAFKYPHVSFSSDGSWLPITPERKHLCTDQVCIDV